MTLSANQALQLLWIHYKEPEYNIGLTIDEVIDLGLVVVSKFSELTTQYREHLVPKTKDELVDFLRKYPAGCPFWTYGE